MKLGKLRFWSHRKLACCIVLLAMLLSLVGIAGPFLTGVAVANENPALSVGSVSGSSGETVTVPVSLTSRDAV